MAFERKFTYDNLKGSITIVDEFIIINTEDFERAEVFLPTSDRDAVVFIAKAGDRPFMKLAKAATMKTLVSMWIGTFPSALRTKLRRLVGQNYKPLKWE